MGGGGSKPALPPLPRPPVLPQASVPTITTPVRPVVAPLTAQETCQVKQVQLNQLTNDLTNKQREVDTCNPQATQQKRLEAAQKEAREWQSLKFKEREQANAEFDKQIKLTDNLVNANAPLKKYLSELESQARVLEGRQQKLEQEERKYRRSFLDSDPQSGVPGPMGLETSDDKIMATFWICYTAAVLACALIVTRMYADRVGGPRQQIVTSVFVTLGAVLVAHSAITNYA